ncbi:MAG: bifunctional DNA-formamidopyrimidine glycosylase/DNA-(apurinic or apyrimidinic site) lyase [Rhodocyclaceae bacterium]|nr:bifunctional DNA-formamidopyrimidine glycosylase/DNA-(apurinic or apyrimidinic site) lyase [Rhodocyclaceae bacterium]
MPELPEVETTRRGIAPHVSDQIVTAVAVREARLRIPVPGDIAARVVGQRIATVRRRGKYLQLDLERDALLIHLGMSGSLRIEPAATPPGRHDHVDIVMGTQTLRYRDPRRFGLVTWFAPQDGPPAQYRNLGIEPLEGAFDGRWLHLATRTLRTPIKLFLMDTHRIVGVGNIYASESLFRARIHPATPAGKLGPARCERLAAAVRETLEEAIRAGGSTLRDFVGGDGRAGYFQHSHAVYGRADAPCPVCGGPVRRSVMGQRATYHCPACQRR